MLSFAATGVVMGAGLVACDKEVELKEMTKIRIVAESASQTKTQIASSSSSEDAIDIWWTPGDKLGVFGSNTTNSEFTTELTSAVPNAEFTGSLSEGDTPVIAYYPYSETASNAASVPFTIASIQQYSDLGSVSANDLKVSSKITDMGDGNYSMQFRNLTSLLKFQIDFRGMTFDSNERFMSLVYEVEGKALTGKYTANLKSSSCALQPVSGQTNSSVTVSIPGTNVSEVATAYANINAAVREGDTINITLTTTSYVIKFRMKASRDYEAGYCYNIPVNVLTASSMEDIGYSMETGGRKQLWDNDAVFSLGTMSFSKAMFPDWTDVLITEDTAINDDSFQNCIVFLENGVTVTFGDNATLGNTVIVSNYSDGGGKVVSSNPVTVQGSSSNDSMFLFWDVDVNGGINLNGGFNVVSFLECNVYGSNSMVSASASASVAYMSIIRNVFHSTSSSSMTSTKAVNGGDNITITSISVRDNMFLNVTGDGVIDVASASQVALLRNHFYYGAAYNGTTTLFNSGSTPALKTYNSTTYYAGGGNGTVMSDNSTEATDAGTESLGTVDFNAGTYNYNYLIVGATSTYGTDNGTWIIDHANHSMALRHCQSDATPDCEVMPAVTVTTSGSLPGTKTLTATLVNGNTETYDLSLMDYVSSSSIMSFSSVGSGWKVVWADEFSGDDWDKDVWTRCPASSPDWAKEQYPEDETLAQVTGNGYLETWGKVADSGEGYDGYKTGGIWGKDLKSFNLGMNGVTGRIDVAARMTDAKGYWPAIWMMPQQDSFTWPQWGEIDLMEHLGSETYYYATLHTYARYNNGDKKCAGTRAFSNRTEFHVFSVVLKDDTLYLALDGNIVVTCAKSEHITASNPDQETIMNYWPYDATEYYLILDSQLNGSWIKSEGGNADGTNLPAHMDIDYVRYMVQE